MKNIYELLNDIDIDESEFEEMEVSQIEKARTKKFLKKSIYKKNSWYQNTIKIAGCGIICLGILSTIFPTYANEIISKTIDTIRGYFEINENGETYGTYIDKDNGEREEPDLIAVIGLNNVEGYVRKVDLYDEENQPNNPEEAIAYMKKREKDGPRIIPVYEKDGKTVIDEYFYLEGIV